MKINYLKARNCGVFKELNLDLNNVSMASIIGSIDGTDRSNTSGKSTIFRIIYYALTGKDYSGGVGGDLIREETNGLNVDLGFEFNGNNYKISRYRRASGGAEAQLYCGGDLMTEGHNNVGEELEILFNMKHFIFGATVFFIQDALDSFTTLDPSERKKYLASILGLDNWEKYLKVAKREVLEFRKKLWRLDTNIENEMSTLGEYSNFDFDSEIASEVEKVEKYTSKLKRIAEKLESAEQDISAVKKQKAEFDALNDSMNIMEGHDPQSYHQLKDIAAKNAGKRKKDLLASKQSYNRSLEQHKADNYKGIALDRRVVKLKRDLDRSDGEIANKEKIIGAIQVAADSEKTMPKCPICLSTLIDGEKLLSNRKIDLYSSMGEKEEIAENYKKMLAIQRERDRLNGIIAKIDSDLTIAEFEHANAVKEFQSASKILKEYREGREEIKKKMAQMSVSKELLYGLERHRESLKERDKENRQKLFDARLRYERLISKRDIVDGVKSRISVFKEERSVVSHDLEEWNKVVAACSRKSGVPVDIIESAVKQIEVDANSFLEQYEAGFSLSLDTVKLTTKGEQRETLDINIHTTHNNNVRSYFVLCGAEKAQVNIALRVALSMYLSQRYDVSIEALFIDEAMASFDDYNKEISLKIFNILSKRFRQIFVISHDSAIRDVLPQTILVNKSGNCSTAEVII